MTRRKKAKLEDEDTEVLDPDSPSFVGVKPEVMQILQAEEHRRGGQLTAEEERAAQLMAHWLDAGAVDVALNLPSGTVKRLMRHTPFEEHAVYWRGRLVNRRVDEDLARLFSPRQRDAAWKRPIDGLTQAEAGEAVGVTARSICGWESQPAYRTYEDQLAREVEERRSRRHIKHSDHVIEVREKALSVLEEAVDEGDRKAAVEVMRIRP